MSEGSVKKSGRSSTIDRFIYDLRTGKAGISKKAPDPEVLPAVRKRTDGSTKFSDPIQEEGKPEKFLDYAAMEPPRVYPNQVKLKIEEGESRFPQEAKVPPYKKYDTKGNYVKHKLSKRDGMKSQMSTGEVVRKHLLSNPRARKPKTVA